MADLRLFIARGSDCMHPPTFPLPLYIAYVSYCGVPNTWSESTAERTTFDTLSLRSDRTTSSATSARVMAPHTARQAKRASGAGGKVAGQQSAGMQATNDNDLRRWHGVLRVQRAALGARVALALSRQRGMRRPCLACGACGGSWTPHARPHPPVLSSVSTPLPVAASVFRPPGRIMTQSILSPSSCKKRKEC